MLGLPEVRSTDLDGQRGNPHSASRLEQAAELGVGMTRGLQEADPRLAKGEGDIIRDSVQERWPIRRSIPIGGQWGLQVPVLTHAAVSERRTLLGVEARPCACTVSIPVRLPQRMRGSCVRCRRRGQKEI
jgi:hypothetical protein